MDKLQRTFSDSYVTNLKNDVKTGVSIEKYSADEFDIDTNMWQMSILRQIC